MLRRFSVVDSVMLKGSYARGEQVAGISDIDLAIVIRNNTTFDELSELTQSILEFKRGMMIIRCPILGEIEIFSRADVMSPMFQAYASRFSWRLVAGDSFPISDRSPSEAERIWSQFGKFVFFHTVARNLVSPFSQFKRDAALAQTLGVRGIPNDYMGAHVAVIRPFDEILAPFVSPDSSYPRQFETDHVGPFTGCGGSVKKQYVLVERFKLPAAAREFQADRKRGLFFPPTFVGPNAMRFVIGPFENSENRMWAELNLQTIRYQWRGSLVNQPSNDGFLGRSAFIDLIRSISALKRNPLVSNDGLIVRERPLPDATIPGEHFRSLFRILSSVRYRKNA